MAKRDDAALKLLRWELEGHGKVVMEAMLRHPDKSLAEAVDLIEQEVPSLSASDRSANDSPSEMPAPVAPSRPRTPPELDALSQEFQTFRHLLHPKEAKEVEATQKELVRSQDREAMTALRRRLRALSLQAAFWSELAAGHKESNAIALVILRKGRGPREGRRDGLPRPARGRRDDPSGIRAAGERHIRAASAGRPARRDDGRGRIDRGAVPAGAREGRRAGPR